MSISLIVLPLVFLQLNRNKSRIRPIQALAAERSVEFTLVRPWNKKAFRRLGRLKMMTPSVRRRVPPLRRTRRSFRPSVCSFSRPLGAVRLGTRGVQISISKSVATKCLRCEIVPGLGLGVLQTRWWSLMNAGVPVEGVGAEGRRAGRRTLGGSRHVAAGDGVETMSRSP